MAGVLVGNAEDAGLRSGATVVLAEAPMTAAVDVRGGGPGTRETDALDPSCLVEAVDAVVLSGGSAFGLDAAGRRDVLAEGARAAASRSARRWCPSCPRPSSSTC